MNILRVTIKVVQNTYILLGVNYWEHTLRNKIGNKNYI